MKSINNHVSAKEKPRHRRATAVGHNDDRNSTRSLAADAASLTDHALADRTDAILDLFERDRWSHAYTVNFHRAITLERATELLRHHFAMLDARCHGSGRWYKVPSCRRINGILVPEVGRCSPFLHFHGCLLVSEEYHALVTALAEQLWKQLVASGTVHIVPLTTPSRWFEYCLKNPQPHDGFIMLRQFHPSRSESSCVV